MILKIACVIIALGVVFGAPTDAADVPSKAHIYMPATTRPAAAEPVTLAPGPHLFIDDFLIAEYSNLRRVINRPTRDRKIANPIITGNEDGNFQPYMTILRDAASGSFRIWYGARTVDRNPTRSRLGYMESDDGIRWNRPHRVLETPLIQFGASVLDEGAAFHDRRQRYKFAWWAPAAQKGQLPGLKLASSPDGLQWTQMTRPGAASDVLLPHNHDINSIFRDPIRKRYVAIASTTVTDPAWVGERRLTMQSVSDDLLEWSPPWRVLVPDPTLEHDQTQSYAMDGFASAGRS